MTYRRLSFIAPLFLVLLLGCNKANPNAPASVKGRVKYQGNLVTAGTVIFHPSEGGAFFRCIIKPDGTYSQTDLTTGEMVVTIETDSADKDRKMPTYGGGRGKPGQGQPQQVQSPVQQGAQQGGGEYVRIPKKYAKKELSNLTRKVEKGENTFDFELTD
jgi:hypothetical protein